MNTADKVQRMFYKAAAAKRLNSKIMQKRAEAVNRPSEAYLAGFCKVAEDAGVDPIELMKAAGWFGDTWNNIKGGFKSFGNSLANVGNNLVNGLKTVGKGAVGLTGGLGGAIRGYGKSLYNGAKGIITGQGLSGFNGTANNIASGFTNGASNAVDAARVGMNAARTFGNGFSNNYRGGINALRNNPGVQGPASAPGPIGGPAPQVASGPQSMPMK